MTVRRGRWSDDTGDLRNEYDGGRAAGKRTITQDLPERRTASSPSVEGPRRDEPAAVGDDPFGLHLVQAKAAGEPGESTTAIHAAAAHGTSGAGGALPFADQIQRSFGRHDIGNIRAHTGASAHEGAAAMGAEAFATGDHVAFGATPTLHTTAHEAAHIVQQRAGVHLKGGVGDAGDEHERHADAVADRVVAGESAESLLDTYAGGGGPAAGGAIQRSIIGSQVLPNRGLLAIDMKPHLGDGKFGEAGSIRFTPDQRGERASEIVLVQAVRNFVPNGDDTEWRGPQQPREMMKTPNLPDNNIEGGWFVDHDSSQLGQRQGTDDAPVRRDYNATIPDARGDDRKGMNLGFMSNDVVLFDHPAANTPLRWTFETAVIASLDGGGKDMRWGAVQWAFETAIKQQSRNKQMLGFDDWQVQNERLQFTPGTTATFESAVAHFDEYYRNPEAHDAPERLEAALLERAHARRDHGVNSPPYLAAHLKVHEYARALRRFVDMTSPPYENPQHVQTFELLQATFRNLIQLAFQRSNQQYHQPDEGLPPPQQPGLPQPMVQQDHEMDDEQEIVHIVETREQRRERWAKMRSDKDNL